VITISNTTPEITAFPTNVYYGTSDQQLYATSTIDPAEPFTYASSNISVATIDSSGLISYIGLGSTTITVSQTTGDPQSINITVDPVLLTVGNVPLNVLAGDSHQLSVTSGLSETITYTSNTPAIATVNSSGLISYIATGTVVISFSQPNSETKIYTITIGPALLTVPITVNGRVGESQQLNVTSNLSEPITYVSSNTTVATVTGSGLITYVGIGSFNITVSQPNSETKVLTVTIEGVLLTVGNVPLNVLAGDSHQLSVTSSLSEPFTYTSNTPAIATVNSSGLISYIATGTVIITFSQPNSVIKTYTITIGPALLTITTTEYKIDPIKLTQTITNLNLVPTSGVIGDSLQFNVSSNQNLPNTITYTSSDLNNATFSETETGLLSYIGTGTVRITVSQPNSVTKIFDIIIIKTITKFDRFKQKRLIGNRDDTAIGIIQDKQKEHNDKSRIDVSTGKVLTDAYQNTYRSTSTTSQNVNSALRRIRSGR